MVLNITNGETLGFENEPWYMADGLRFNLGLVNYNHDLAPRGMAGGNLSGN